MCHIVFLTYFQLFHRQYIGFIIEDAFVNKINYKPILSIEVKSLKV